MRGQNSTFRVAILGQSAEAERFEQTMTRWTRRIRVFVDPDSVHVGTIRRADGILLLSGFALQFPDWHQRLIQSRKHRATRQNRLPVVLVVRGEAESAFAEMENPAPEAIDFRVVQISRRGARLLFSRFPLHRGQDMVFEQKPAVLIAGSDEMAWGILRNLLRSAHYGPEKPQIILVDEDTESFRQRVQDKLPQAPEIADILYCSPEKLLDPAHSRIRNVYVCMNDSATAISTAYSIRDGFSRRFGCSPRIYLNLQDFESSADAGEWDGQIVAFSALNEVCNPEVLFGDRQDQLAAIIHEYYLDSIDSQGRVWNATPAGQTWDQLPDSYREASRHQGDHIPNKLASISCRIVRQEASSFFTFRPQEVEKLSILEHTRWSADRYVDGWRFGPERDNEQKIHPELKPYDDLTVAMKDLDRYAVRLIPALLGRQERAIKRDLLIAVVNSGVKADTGPCFEPQVRQILRRMVSRYPDRTLVLAVVAADDLGRRFADIGYREFQTPLRVLINEPIARVRQRLSPEHRLHFLTILSVAEQFIDLHDNSDLNQWLCRRSDITVRITDSIPESRDRTADSSVAGTQSVARDVWLDPGQSRSRWTFEY